MRSIVIAVALLVPAFASAQSIAEKAGTGDIVFMQDEAPAMRKAFDKASTTLDGFLATASAASPAHTNFALKVAISQGENTEYFWVNRFAQRSDGSFEGDIANEPRMVKHVKLGQRYSFPRARIVDWTYTDQNTGAMVGNFTLCALLTQEPAAQADALRKRFKLDCGWLRP